MAEGTGNAPINRIPKLKGDVYVMLEYKGDKVLDKYKVGSVQSNGSLELYQEQINLHDINVFPNRVLAEIDVEGQLHTLPELHYCSHKDGPTIQINGKIQTYSYWIVALHPGTGRSYVFLVGFQPLKKSMSR